MTEISTSLSLKDDKLASCPVELVDMSLEKALSLLGSPGYLRLWRRLALNRAAHRAERLLENSQTWWELFQAAESYANGTLSSDDLHALWESNADRVRQAREAGLPEELVLAMRAITSAAAPDEFINNNMVWIMSP